MRLREATYNVLVGIHEDVKTKAFCYSEDGYRVLYPILIIPPRPFMLNRLPGENISNRVVSPPPQPRKVCGSIVNRERAVYEGDIVAVEELVGDV